MFNLLLAIGIMFGAFWLLALLFGPPSATKQAPSATTDTTGSSNPQTIGLLTGLLGGDIQDAAKAQFALRSLQESTGREPNLYETGLAVSMTVSQSESTRVNQE